jgi:hypothetical protein
LAGCSPALDWRDARPGDGPLQVLMPCKPAADQRPADVGGATVAFTLSACEASGHTYAVLAGRLPDGADTDAALRALRLSLAARVGASAEEGVPVLVKGVPPGPESRRFTVRGQRPDGQALVVEAAVLRHQGWVYQASVTGPQAAGEAAQAFFEGLRGSP